jgi:hypothetical protein
MKKQIALIACLSAISTVTWAAQSQETFSQLDANKDGYISVQEAEGNKELAMQWGKLDQNNDDQLDQSEFSAFEVTPSASDTMGTQDNMNQTK